MTAHQARIKTEKSIIDKIEAKLTYTYAIIQEEAESGKYEARIKNIIPEPEQLEELRRQGYKVELYETDHGYQTVLFISWKEELANTK